MKDSNMLRGGQLLAKSFKEKGVEHVFTLAGGFCNPALEGFMNHQVPVINCPHEQIAGHLADGHTRLSRKPSVCLVGPEGFANAIPAMMEAWGERSPVIFVTGSSTLKKQGAGGFKEMIFSVKGENIYSYLKYESGVHRVQRVPTTEAQGRVHTSAATVAILPEAEDVDIKINESDLRIDVFRSSGPGGQSVNTTDSAVRITHIPSGIVVSQQDEKSQHKNRAKAMKILQSRLYEVERQKQQDKRSSTRKDQVGSGDRSERIRTYNFPQGRVTDHRINLTLHKLEKILSGEALDDLIDALVVEDRMLKLTSNDL